jgi:hypothetical protein
MIDKICSKCKLPKSLDNFGKHRSGKLGCQDVCKLCRKQYYISNKEYICNKSKFYNLENKDKIKKQNSIKYIKNKEVIIEKTKEYYIKNKENIDIKSKEYRAKNKDKISKDKKEYYLNKREYFIDRAKKNSKIYIRNRYKLDYSFKLRKNISRAINLSLKKFNSSKRGESILKYLIPK